MDKTEAVAAMEALALHLDWVEEDALRGRVALEIWRTTIFPMRRSYQIMRCLDTGKWYAMQFIPATATPDTTFTCRADAEQACRTHCLTNAWK